MSDQKLFEHMQNEHDLILVESELREIQLLCQPKWKLLSESTPEPDQLCVFAEWHKPWNRFILEYVGSLKEVKSFRKYQLDHNYTHYLEILDKP